MHAAPGRVRWMRPFQIVAAVAIVGWLLAACGGSSPPTGVATLKSQDPGPSGASAQPSPSQDPYQAMLAYSQCMRDHGISDFPDPQVGANGGVQMQVHGGPGSDINPNSPTFQTAQQACQSLMPAPPQNGNGTQNQVDQQKLLAYSQCMRDNGISDYPDPQFASNGGVTMRMPQDIDPNSPTFQAAQRACQAQFPGGGMVVNGRGPAGSTAP